LVLLLDQPKRFSVDIDIILDPSINGKKKKLRKKDYLEAINRFDIDAKAIENMFDKFKKAEKQWHEFIDISFLPDDMKSSFHDLIEERVSRVHNS
jgi:serine/threonine-protein kinase HipA